MNKPSAMVRTALMLLLAAPSMIHAQAPAPGSQKAVLITGAATGIERYSAERLAAEGYFVYASVRTDDDLRKLPSHKNIRGLRLDVTSAQDIAAAVATITKEGRGLYGLINSAGVISSGTVAQMKPAEFDLVMAVNVTGVFRVTQAFLPLIIAQKGRVVTIGSIHAFGGAPGGSDAYNMSKHAVEGFTDSLAGEMKDFGVHVSVIESGTYKSAIHHLQAERGNLDMQAADKIMAGRKEPDEVAAAAFHAIDDENPKRRYLVVPNAGQADGVIKGHITRLVQINEGTPYTYDREALIAVLDQALVGARPRTKNYDE